MAEIDQNASSSPTAPTVPTAPTAPTAPAARASAAEPPLLARGVRKSYPSGEGRIEVLRGVDLEVLPGEVIAIVGFSGSGKSTLLNVLGALDRPDAGEIRYGGHDVVPLGEEERAHLRERHVGFVFQYHHLLAEFTALENVMIPLLLAGREPREASDQAANYLELVGLAERLDHPPNRLSGGEQQRVAIARAIAGDPALVLADEPTGNLDRQTGEGVFELLYSLARNRLQSWVVATHNEYLAGLADKRWRVADGRLRPHS